MDRLAILTEIKERDDLLSLPQALAEILREVDNPDFTADSLARIILRDPPLTGRILKMANSSFYSRFAGISTVHQAVPVLGANTVKCLALSTSVFDPAKIASDSGTDPQQYFANVLTVAAGAEKIASTVEYRASEEAFIAGLLHDIGSMYLIHHYPAEYRKIVRGEVPGVSNILDAEQAVFGVDHCEVGYHLLVKWRLPTYIAEAVRDHHRPADNSLDARISAIVRLASLLTEDSGSPYSMDLEDRLQAIGQTSEALGLSKEDIDSISISLMSATISAAEYLGVDIGSIEEILTRANQEIWHTYLMIENLFKERQDLSQKLLQQERARGAYESKTIAMATLSHYLNNAAMAIYGRSQILRMQHSKNDNEKLLKKLPESLDVIDKSIQKMVAVLAEMKEISPIDEVEFLSTSKAMNMDDRIARRMDEMEKESGLLLPDEAVAPIA
ncbi:MAG: HDOD domain-containing protein [candidate division Zixibacteria bacterium]|nr:HDOD domain-containing protein [candidate division Zixibacteria bacterium]